MKLFYGEEFVCEIEDPGSLGVVAANDKLYFIFLIDLYNSVAYSRNPTLREENEFFGIPYEGGCDNCGTKDAKILITGEEMETLCQKCNYDLYIGYNPYEPKLDYFEPEVDYF